MLQQTQADRVVPKFLSFLERFPTLESLAEASNEEVLREWRGLGYNRRGLNLKRTAEIILHDFKGVIPEDTRTLTSLPGIGPYTAAAIQAFAFNIPSVVIETNIRAVFIKYFFKHTSERKIKDTELVPFIEESLDFKNPREWYAALMDYGAHIKRTEKNFSRQSSLYSCQSQFIGSNRENRSHILELLFKRPHTKEEIISILADERTSKNLTSLKKEGFLSVSRGIYSIKK